MPESQNIEYKSSWRDEYLKWICGFTNANGGSIFIGEDDVKNVVGVAECETLNYVSKANATRDLTELVEKFKILGRTGDIGAGTSYILIGS